MKRLLVMVAVASLLLPGISVAQNNGPPGQPGERGPAQPGGGRPGGGAPQRPGPPGGPQGGRPGGAPQRPGQPGGPHGGRPGTPNRPGAPNRPGTPARPGRPGTPSRPNRPSQPGRPPTPGQPGRPPSGGRPPHRPAYARPLPPRGNQFWHRGQYYGRIRGPAFAYPPGWQYRAWTIGALFPPLFLTPNYFYPGYAALGLEAPLPGYAWVRFGPDLVLVNLSNYQIEDVVYGVFY